FGAGSVSDGVTVSVADAAGSGCRLWLPVSEEFGQWPAVFEQMQGTAFSVRGGQVVDPHRVEGGSGNGLRGGRVVGRVLGSFFTCAVALSPRDATARQQHRHAGRPVIPPGAPTRAWVADLWLAAHLAGYQHQGRLQQAALVQVVEQGCEGPVK